MKIKNFNLCLILLLLLSVTSCKKDNLIKIKVKKWLGISDIKSYERYIWDWHQFVNQCEEALEALEEEQRKILTLYILKTFFQTTYPEADFYTEFYTRLEKAKEMFGF